MRVAPRAATSDGEDAAWLSAQYGLTLDPWQDECLGDWLGRSRNARWAAATCGLAVPRQNGKNAIIEARELFGMVVLGEKFLHTAHEVKTARKAFRRLLGFFENDGFPELAGLVVEIRKTNGQEAIVLRNGGSVEFVARSRGSGRGFTVDVLVCDEAQDLTDEELEALLPTISAAPLGNPQVVLTGTPPDAEKNQTGEVFSRVRKDGESRTDRHLAWTDFGPPDGPLPDVDDRDGWYAHNPALGIRLNVAEVEREHRLMSPEGFARERLGWWGLGDAELESFLSFRRWRDGESTAAIGKVAGFAVEVSMDRMAASIAAAGQVDPERFAVELLPWSRDESAPCPDGVGWVLARCVELAASHESAIFAVDAGGPAASLIEPMQRAGLTVRILTVNEVRAATAAFVDGVNDGSLLHGPQPELDTQVREAKTRPLGDGGQAISRKKSKVPVHGLIAATFAHLLARDRRTPEVWSIRELMEQIRQERADEAAAAKEPAGA